MNDIQTESAEIIRNAIAAYRRHEIIRQDMLDIWRRAGMDAALSADAQALRVTVDPIHEQRGKVAQ